MKEETYQVKDYLRYRILGGIEQIQLSWVHFRGKSWQPLESLYLKEEDEQYMEIIREQYRTIKAKYQEKGIKTDLLEIINPHLRNAKQLQAKLDLKYGYFQSDSEELRSFREEAKQEQSSSVYKTKLVKKSKQERKAIVAKLYKEKAIKWTKSSFQPKQYKNPLYVSNYGDFVEYPPAPKATFESKSLLSRNTRQARSKQIVPFEKDFEQVFEKQHKEAEGSFELQMLKKLLVKSQIKDSFRRNFQGTSTSYYEVKLGFPGINHPILIPEDILQKVCPNELVTFLTLKNLRK